MNGKFVFILKAVVCNVEDSHYYAFIRNDFSEEFQLVNDSSIKIASKEQIDASPTVLGLYYVFQHLDTIPEKHPGVTLTTKKLEISDDIKNTQ